MQRIVRSVTLSPLRRLTVKICRMVGKCRIIGKCRITGKCTVEKSLRGEICRMAQHVVMLLSVAAIIILSSCIYMHKCFDGTFENAQGRKVSEVRYDGTTYCDDVLL